MKKILIVVGTRPNFIKVTQFKTIAEKHFPGLEIRIVHTGQHYGTNMSEIFFKQFGLFPDYFLEIGQGSPLNQIAGILTGIESLVNETWRPDLMIVPGDVNSTVAAALAANKLNIPLAHLESGLRSFDRDMPEEFNRLVTDELSDHFFITEPSGIDNIKKEEKSGKIHFVGNTMIDTMVAFEDQISQSDILEKLKIDGYPFVLATFHRPSNVDDRNNLLKLVRLLTALCEKYKVVFPIHPRTVKGLGNLGIYEDLKKTEGLVITEPIGYFEFQKLIRECEFVITDSGGIQEETTFRLKPCLTVRENTERPVTVTEGTNTLVSFDVERILKYVKDINEGTYKKGRIPQLWDGNSTFRILEILSKELA